MYTKKSPNDLRKQLAADLLIIISCRNLEYMFIIEVGQACSTTVCCCVLLSVVLTRKHLLCSLNDKEK